jgi:16S rRNA (uracil1498-N3)-methyltransferase
MDEMETHHAHKVLRKAVGDAILVSDGKGIIYEATITTISKRSLSFENTAIFKSEKKTRFLHLAVAPTKSNERFEFFLEKATELGIDTITPIQCFNSERKAYKYERGLKIVQGAAKQSLSCHWPKLHELCTLTAFLANHQNTQGEKYIAHCHDEARQDYFSLPKATHQLILIGPEGDFSLQEVEAAIKNGFAPISLGNKRLRTETAALAACFGFNY